MNALDLSPNLLRSKSDGRVVDIPVKDLYETFDVRLLEQGCNEDRVMSLKDTFSTKAYKDDPTLVPPIIVELATGNEIDNEDEHRRRRVPNGSYIVPEGRHRRRGAKAAGVEFIRAIPMYDLTEEERRLIAVGCNMVRGPLMMEQSELVQQAMLFAKPVEDGGLGMPLPEVRRKFAAHAGVTKTSLDKTIRQVDSNLDDVNKRKAMTFYNDEDSPLTTKQKLEFIQGKWGFRPATVKGWANPERRKSREQKTEIAKGLAGGVTKSFQTFKKGLERSRATMVKFYVDDVDGGIVSANEVDDLLLLMERNAKSLQKTILKARLKFKSQVQPRGSGTA
jgi:hypothetical protein